MDPLVRALTETLELVFERGVVVLPQGEDGWLVRVASEDVETVETDEGRARRSW